MDFSESTKVVYNRIQKLEPENVSKIIGYLLLQDHGEREMIRLAFSPDNAIHSLIAKAKSELGLSKPAVSVNKLAHVNSAPTVSIQSAAEIPVQFTPFSPASAPALSPPSSLRITSPYWESQVPGGHVPDDFHLINQVRHLGLEDPAEFANFSGSEFMGSYYFPEAAICAKSSRRSPSLPDFPVKICHYFNKGFCKHGNNCRYFHGHLMPESFSQHFNANYNEIGNDDHAFIQGSLDKLEMELAELLKSRGGMPVSIASLPMLYYEKYGRTLQAEGYLTESQRHGKAGFSLSKLLSRLKSSICLIDRPHGQHSVILAEDAQKYLDYTIERCDPGVNSGSRQIYLTFPAESVFTEQDVSHYFNNFGPVQDVRIPCQQKRMFGFVTFVFAETAKQVLAKGNPHFICNARVLVKPYKEKSRLFDRRYMEKMQNLTFNYNQHLIEGETDIQSMPRSCDNSRFLRKEVIQEHETALEFERRRFAEFHMAPKALARPVYFGHLMDQLNPSEGHEEPAVSPPADHFNHFLDFVQNGSSNTSKISLRVTNCTEQDSSQGINLPDSPFASTIGTGISTVT
ncbi:zinc finger CCCH domain-containing protein 18 isoform X1 [Eucalyptus grandis]|uniref:zinc finger CCCH domain-containing protein 18 isoform X1 n=1 Tax=Eucalyptus grandis TaxID=71139 RepID=UPI00192E8ECE|nr:zinc finger CCCH domain-containing protein 18 isoform X1 [Eucalyptus grandis]XP_010035441.2 zinc finger CCCH domain-containing protein 18 isoform X1 [Eucalyptus grandis]